MKIKGFDKNLCCRGMQYEIGKEYKKNVEKKDMRLCSDTVFHYCDSLIQVHNFYSCTNKNNRFCEIEVLGDEITDNEKCGSNHIKIVREIKGEELEKLKGKINGNTGLFNTGKYNTGNGNTGNGNTEDFNTGSYNVGGYNVGNRNVGNRNAGSYNTGNSNAGGYNTGNRNTGSCNEGNYNAGNYNAGDCNTGDYNTGNSNAGDFNTGNWNAGSYNVGDCNVGDWNSCNHSNGFFNTIEDNDIKIFNKGSGMSCKEFYNSKYYRALISVPFILTEWIPGKEQVGGYLKEYTYEEACKNWWEKLTEENKNIIKEIPNFDKAIFKEITGIDI